MPLRQIVPVAVAPEAVAAAEQSLRRGLDGSGAVPLLASPGSRHRPSEIDDDPDDPIAVAVTTSGSTGDPKVVLLPVSALDAAIDASQRRLGSDGPWLLAIPPWTVGGLMVMLRNLLTRRPTISVDSSSAFTADTFAAAAHRIPTGPAWVSLVPTQLARLVAVPAGLRALRRFDGVLLGAAPASHVLLDAAAQAGLNVVRSYGMTETCGGCVYDGVPLDGVEVEIADNGSVAISGPQVARGYLRRSSPAFSTAPWTTRRFATNDAGRWTSDGRLEILGRTDDVLISGGINVSAQAVEVALADAPGVAAIAVTAVSDEKWGQVVAAVVVPKTQKPPELDELRAIARARLGPAAAPRRLLIVDELPLVAPGKVDRTALTALCRALSP